MTSAEHWLGELLAVIHCDGGHYQAAHGDEKAVKDAIARWNQLARCPHGMPLAENICGPCSQGRLNRQPPECICPTCGLRHGSSNLDGGF